MSRRTCPSLHRLSNLKLSSQTLTSPCLLVVFLLLSPRVSSSRILCTLPDPAGCSRIPHSSASNDPSPSNSEEDGDSPRGNSTAFRALMRALSRDPCEDLHRSMKSNEPITDSEGYSFYTVRPSELRACRRHALGASNIRIRGRFQRQQSLAMSDLDNVVKLLSSLYGLLHVAKNSTVNQLPSQYDVVAALKKLKSRKWDSVDDLYNAMGETLRRLNDAHTYVQQYFGAEYYTLPLNLVYVKTGDTTWEVRVAPRALQQVKLIEVAKKQFSFNPERYYGATVNTIEGMFAWHYVRNYARDQVGLFPNFGARVNAALAHLAWNVEGGEFPQLVLQSGFFSERRSYPKSATLKMVVTRVGAKGSEQIKVPWMSNVPFSQAKVYRNSQAFANNFWTESRVRREAQRLQRWKRSRKEWEFMGKGRDIEPGEVPRFRAQLTLSKASKISGTKDFFPVFKLADKKTAVVVVPSFYFFINNSLSDAENFLGEAIKAFRTAVSPKSGAKRVIIDLQGNGGGVVRWGYWLQQILIGSNGFNQGPTLSYRVSDFLRIRADGKFVKALVDFGYSPFQWWRYSNVSGKPFTSPAGFFYPAVKLPFGGVKDANYSRWVKIATTKIEEELNVGSFAPILNKRPFLLLSDGSCYSTCSTFSAGLKERFKTKLVTVGGLPYQPLQFHAGGGGFVLPGGMFNYGGLPLPEAPGRMNGIDGGMKLAIGFLSTKSPTPTEFTFHPGDARVFYTPQNILDPSLIWSEAALSFTNA